MRTCSWLLRIEAGRHTLRAGNHVERGDGFFAEGAWTGPYTAAGLRGSGFVCGSGGILNGPVIHVMAPSHSVEGVYCFVGERSVHVSNSAHAILAACPEAALPDHQAVLDRMRSARDGIRAYDRLLYQVGGGRMLRFAFAGFSIDTRDLSISEHARPRLPRTFHTYQAYRDTLRATLCELWENATAAARLRPYRHVVTTCSAGYDSVACTALAAQLGATDVLSLAQARGSRDDSGGPTAEALGLNCLEFERPGLNRERLEGRQTWLDIDHLPSTGYDDFLATLGSSEDLFFATFEPHLRDALVLTGFHGDKAWAPGCPSGADIVRGDNSGSGLDEFRRRVGFVHVPVPFIGIEQHEALARIGADPAMTAFAVGGKYARPIPRRLAEEARVPRAAFGVRKSAGSVILAGADERRARACAALVAAYRNDLSDAEPFDFGRNRDRAAAEADAMAVELYRQRCRAEHFARDLAAARAALRAHATDAAARERSDGMARAETERLAKRLARQKRAAKRLRERLAAEKMRRAEIRSRLTYRMAAPLRRLHDRLFPAGRDGG